MIWSNNKNGGLASINLLTGKAKQALSLSGREMWGLQQQVKMHQTFSKLYWTEIFARVATAFPALLIVCMVNLRQLHFYHFPKLCLRVLPSCLILKPSHNGSPFTDSQEGEDWPRALWHPTLKRLLHIPACSCWTAAHVAQRFPAPPGNPPGTQEPGCSASPVAVRDSCIYHPLRFLLRDQFCQA